MARKARISTLPAVVCLLVLGCSDPSEEPSPAAAGTTEPASATAPTPPPTTPSSPATEATNATTAASLAPGTLVVASDRGVDVVAPDGTAEAATSIPAQRAFADGAGGVVFQGTAPPGEDPPSPAIMWLPPDGGDAVTIFPDGYADVVVLQDAGLVGGEPSAVITTRSDVTTPEDATELLQLLPVGDGAAGAAPRELAEIGGWESGAGDVTLGGDLLAVNAYAESESWFDFYDLSGEPVDVPANPLPSAERCQGDGGCPHLVTIDEAGAQIAWLTGDVGSGGTLHVASRAAAGDASVIEWPGQEAGVVFERLELGSDTAVVSRVRDTGEGFAPIVPLVIDLTGEGSVRDGEHAGFTSVAAS